ncbi:MAG TPA: glycosyltransferase family 1 protein, partial [Desulfobulbaceae bacterium]|nr:glycosyltransferase family 1 protein [Desulfobulbaceae bacterium]
MVTLERPDPEQGGRKKKNSLLPIALISIVLCGVLTGAWLFFSPYALFNKKQLKPAKPPANQTSSSIQEPASTPAQLPSSLPSLQSDTQPPSIKEQSAPATEVPVTDQHEGKQKQCGHLAAGLRTFFTHLDRQEYIQDFHLGVPAQEYFLGLATKVLSCKRVVTCHDLIPLKYPSRYAHLKDGYGWGRHLLDHRRYHSADHIIAVSHATAEDLVQLLGVASSKITVVHNGVDRGKWSAAPQATDYGVVRRHGLSQFPYALFVGDADWRKNVGGMLAALAKVRRMPGGRELRLVWAGKLSEERHQQIDAVAAAVGVRDAVVLLGYVSDADLAALYRHAVCQLFVSRAEGFGYPV